MKAATQSCSGDTTVLVDLRWDTSTSSQVSNCDGAWDLLESKVLVTMGGFELWISSIQSC